MRIERIEIDGFGRFHDEHWSLDEGLTVLLGANEAGKTTLLNALRALLFGFEASRDGRTWYPALGGGRRGGRLALVTAVGERWIVERHGERGGAGALAVRAPNGNQGGQETLDRLLHGADKDLFTSIFAFGLAELQTFASLSAEGVRGRIYGAAAGLGGASAVDLERRLRQQMEAVFVPSGSKRPLNALLARIEEVRALIADLARQPEEHATAHAERADLVERARSLRERAGGLRDELARMRRLRDARPVALALAELEAELGAGDPSLDVLPEDAISVLDERAAQLNEARAVLATLDAELDEARNARGSVVADPDVLQVADEILAVAAERARLTATAQRRLDLEAGVERQDAIVAEQLARVGTDDEAALLALDDSIPSVEATREHEARLAAARAAAATAEERRRAVAEELAGTDGAAGDEDAGAADLDARLAALRELDAEALARPTAQIPRWATPAGAAVLAGLAGLLAFAVGLMAASPAVGVLAGAAAAAAFLVTVRVGDARRSAGSPRLAALLARAGLPANASAAQVAALREELIAARARRDLADEARTRVAVRRAELERRERDAATAEQSLAAAEFAWAAWLAARGLPDGISSDAARHVLAAAGIARRAAAERDHQRGELARMAEHAAGVAARTDALLTTLGIGAEASEGGRDARVAGLVERLERARAEDRRGRELDERLRQLAARRAAALTRVEEREAALSSHLTVIGCADPHQARRRAAAAAERRRLRGEVRERRTQLALLAGAEGADELAASARAVDPAGLDADEAAIRAALERVEGEEREATTRIGALDARIAALEAAEELGALRQELAVLEGRAAAMAREWSVRAVALRLLEETRSRYERERQPDVLRAAESHFERITGGRYTRIVAPPGDGSVRVETEGGESRVTDELSRGTAEQLYLAMRFGLIEEFARHAEPLPVVMDDILVNFDAERAARAASAIRDLAGRHQVLYFTCHAWTAGLLDPGGARTLPLG